MVSDWFETSGARKLRDASAHSYQEHLRHSESCVSPLFEEDARQIELDLPRTGESIRLFLLSHSEREAFQEDEELPQHVMQRFLPQLKNILVAYSMRNPRVGYVQGHADVLCFLFGNVNERRDEEETFWVYASVIERVFPEDFFARTPKLHGFQVDCKLYNELVVRKLVPLYPILAKIDLPLVTTLLSCKWFVSLWVGELPLPLLYEVWDTMLREDDGTILHLLVALHFFRLAVDEIQLHMEMEQWDSSYIYKIILGQCQNATEIAPQTLLQQAQTLYGFKDESVEDMRAAIRRLPQLRKAELTVLAKQTHFSRLEMERLQDEFTFLRYQRKTCGRSKLRGLRQKELESILAREFNTWPMDIYGRIYSLLRPDGYGNISYYNLIKFLSVASRGGAEEKAHLLFQISNQQSREYLNQQDIEKLTDLLCCLLTNRMVADAEEPQRRDHVDSVSDAAKSPLLRMHFRTKLQSLATSDGRLQYTKWLEFALADSEMAQLMEWEMINRRSGGTLRLKTRSVSFWGVTPVQPALSRASSDSTLQLQQQHSSKRLLNSTEGESERNTEHTSGIRESNNFGVESAPFLKKSALVTEQGLVGRRHVTLLSRKMSKKFKACWPPDEADPLVRNPFKEPPEAASSGGPYVFWCQCTVS
ncbi:Rab-GTPase-TBC domain [Phytophthora infestans]|uniref:Rab-GTPase-TBC domain n=1 Tax=Phytophthora infestans TaxID=4787 RepID=A0A833SK66_PHYIN|nr:Rab-GTPase-TBC domain [Phytophthora infestans]KAF4130605.1 Rab-GTPase-TBC domain [Phytophthora infestans]